MSTSTTVYAWGTVCLTWVILAAMPRRIWVSGHSTSPPVGAGTAASGAGAGAEGAGGGAAAATTGGGGAATGGATAGTGAGAAAAGGGGGGSGAAGAGVGAASAAGAAAVPPSRAATNARTSSRVTRPPAPVPGIWVTSRLCSRTSRRTAGVMRIEPSVDRSSSAMTATVSGSGLGASTGVGSVAGSATAGAAGSGSGAASATGAASSTTGSASLAGGASSSGSAVSPTAAASTATAASATGSAAGSASATAAAPSPFSVISASGVPTFTVWPSPTRMLVTTPPTSAGTSALTLSVTTSNSGSYWATLSPTLTSHRSMVPSVTDSPSCGILIVVAIGPEL